MVEKHLFQSITAVLLDVSLVALAGCGGARTGKEADLKSGAESTQTETDGNESGTKDSADAGEVVELRFHDCIPNPEREAKFKELVERFNEANPDIKVTFESTPWDQAHNKMVTQGSSDTLPDVSIIHTSWISEFSTAGWVVPLDDYIAGWEYGDQFIPYARNVLMDYDQKQVYGNIYGIPDGLTISGLYVRKDWVEEIGMTLEDLETWDGVFEAIEKMTDPAKNRYGLAFRGSKYGAYQMGTYLLGALGGRLYEEDGTCRINTPEGLAAFERYCNLYLDGYAPQDSINWGYAEMVQGFTSGLSGVLNQTTEVTAVCAESMSDEEWTVVQFPRFSDGNIYSTADSYFYAVTSSSRHPDEAWRFVSFMLEPENNMEYCEVNMYIPVMQGAEEDPRFAQGYMAGFTKTMNDPNFIRNPYYGYFPEQTEFTDTIYDQEMQRYLLGQQSAQEAVDNIADFLTQAQQRFMEESPQTPLPCAVRADGTEVK